MLLASVAAFGSDRVVGAVALVYLQTLFWNAVIRSATGDPLIIRHRAMASEEPVVIGGASLVALATAGVGTLTTAALVFTSLRPGEPLLLAATIPFVALHDIGRAVFFARRQPLVALYSDSVWLGVQCAGVLIVALLGDFNVAWSVATWGIGVVASSLFSLTRFKVEVRRGIGAFMRATHGLRVGLVGGSALVFIGRNLTYYLMAAFVGLEELGDLRRGLVAFAPVSAIFAGVSSTVIPDLTNHPERLWRSTLRLAGVFALFATVWGVAAVGLVHYGPFGVRRITGDSSLIVGLLALSLIAQGLTRGAGAGLSAAERPRRAIPPLAVGVAAMVVLVVVLVPRYGAVGGAAVLVAGNAVEGFGMFAMLAMLVGTVRRTQPATIAAVVSARARRSRKRPSTARVRIDGDVVVKRSVSDPEAEFEKARRLHELGLSASFVAPRPIDFDASSGTVRFERIELGVPLRAAMLDALDQDADRARGLLGVVGETIGRIHAQLDLPGAAEEAVPPAVERHLTNRARAVVLNDAAKGLVIGHGDFGTSNIFVTAGDETARVTILDSFPNLYSSFRANNRESRYMDLGLFESCLLGRFSLPEFLIMRPRAIAESRKGFVEGYERGASVAIDESALRDVGVAVLRSYLEQIRHWPPWRARTVLTGIALRHRLGV